jgi:hypothetical protein
LNKIVSFFSIIGVLATVFSSYISYRAYAEDASGIDGGLIHIIHWKVVQVLSPSGYQVKNNSLSIIPNDYEFTLSEGDSTLLTHTKRIPFSLKYTKTSRSTVMLDGRLKYMDVGEKEILPNTNCYVWLHRIINKKSLFQLRCKNT